MEERISAIMRDSDALRGKEYIQFLLAFLKGESLPKELK